ncbi:MAG: glycosyltransferase [Alphaproteobacteria bacterium]|jgi:glycosyltransferase involved in cell wall biosynthesis|nr:glycosyltransferase [Alphaproteobacteria bacterium]
MSNNLKEIKVSLIVPFYGVEDYIEDCIKSLINQDMVDMEIILVDDCSPDGSLAIAEKYAKLDSRIKIIRHEVNKKQGGARNTGLQQAIGEYVWFIDSDDYLINDSSIIHNLYTQANSVNADWLRFDIYRNIKGKLNYESSVKDFLSINTEIHSFNKTDYIINFLLNHCVNIAVWRNLYKREFLQKNKFIFPESTTYEDVVNVLWMSKAEVASYIPNAYYVWCKRSNSTSHAEIKKNLYKDNIIMGKVVANLIDIKNWSDLYAGVNILLILFLWQSRLIKEFNTNDEAHKQQMVKEITTVLTEISYIFNSQYFDDAIAFGKINFPKKLSKEDLIELIIALKSSDNQDNLKTTLYKIYTKLNKASKFKRFLNKFR